MTDWMNQLEKRIALFGERLTLHDHAPEFAVPFELTGGGSYMLDTRGGAPLGLRETQTRSLWAIVVDDPALIAPLHDPLPLTDVRGCSLRLGDRSLPLPMVFEVDNMTPERFPERIRGTKLYCHLIAYGTPVGSVRYSWEYLDGVPYYRGDDPDISVKTPFMAAGLRWPEIWAYRRGELPQMEILLNTWVHCDWKDLLAVHALYDAEGYGRIYAEYPDLPGELIGYCWALAAATEQSKPEAIKALPTPS